MRLESLNLNKQSYKRESNHFEDGDTQILYKLSWKVKSYQSEKETSIFHDTSIFNFNPKITSKEKKKQELQRMFL